MHLPLDLLDVRDTGRKVRRWLTGKNPESPIRAKRVARIGLSLVRIRQRMIPPRLRGKLVIKRNECQQYPDSSDLFQRGQHWGGYHRPVNFLQLGKTVKSVIYTWEERPHNQDRNPEIIQF